MRLCDLTPRQLASLKLRWEDPEVTTKDACRPLKIDVGEAKKVFGPKVVLGPISRRDSKERRYKYRMHKRLVRTSSTPRGEP